MARWIAVATMWLAAAGTTVGVAALVDPDHVFAVTLTVAVIAFGAAGGATGAIARHDPATFEDDGKK